MHRFALSLMMSWLVVGVAMASPDKASPNAEVAVEDVGPRASRTRVLAPVAPRFPEANLLEVEDDLLEEWVRVEGADAAVARWRQVADQVGR